MSCVRVPCVRVCVWWLVSFCRTYRGGSQQLDGSAAVFGGEDHCLRFDAIHLTRFQVGDDEAEPGRTGSRAGQTAIAISIAISVLFKCLPLLLLGSTPPPRTNHCEPSLNSMFVPTPEKIFFKIIKECIIGRSRYATRTLKEDTDAE